MKLKTWKIAVLVTATLAAGGYVYWQQQIESQLPDGIVSTNGRIEADQINIGTKLAGRVLEISVDEGDMVDAGQIVAHMDAAGLEAQIRGAEAEVRRTERAKEQASASVARASSQLRFAEVELKRVQQLQHKGFASAEKLDQRQTEIQTANANYRVNVAALEQAGETITSAQEKLAELKTVLEDTVLRSPKRGRIQYRLAEPGEVLAAGGLILTLLDVSDVYMTVFLPAADAGKLIIGSDARIILDPIPQYVIPGKVSFIASEAQFTPKTVETAEERAKLMFRVKLKIDQAVLKKYEDRVKTGVRGMAYLRLPRAGQWTDNLQIKLPE